MTVLLVAAPEPWAGVSGGNPERWSSESGDYRVGYTSRAQPVPLNLMHAWVLHLQTADGTPVEGATITAAGGMPIHDHGLPTAPRVTRELGGGDYLLEGLRFHMNGAWEIYLDVRINGRREAFVIPLVL